MVLPDPRASRVVLFGAAHYESPVLQDLPAVANNLVRLAEHFCDPSLWGVPAENCTVLDRPSDELGVLNAIRDAVDQATDTLVIYYSGHGLVDPETDELYLALPSTEEQRLFTAVEYGRIRSELIRARRILRKVVILDCCFSGRAMIGGMSGPSGLMDLGQIEGTYLLAAAGETQVAVAPDGEEFTAFTGELVEAFSKGVPGGSEFLDLDTLYRHILTELTAKGRPRPHQRNRNSGGLIALGRNRRYRPSRTGSFSEELATLLRGQHQAANAPIGQLTIAHGKSMAEQYVRQDLRRLRHLSEDPPGGDTYRTARVGIEDVRHTGVPRPIGEVLNRHQHVVLVGGPGLGKTTMVVQLASQLAMPWLAPELHDALAATGTLLPIRVEAADLVAHTGPIETTIAESASAMTGMALSSNLLDLAPRGACWLVLLDGLDEIADYRSRRGLLLRLAEVIKSDQSRLRLMITTRSLPPEDMALLDLPPVGHYELQPFSRGQLVDFAERFSGDKDQTSGQLPDFLGRLDAVGLGDLIGVPLFAAIAVAMPDERSTADVPKSRHQLLDQYLAHLSKARSVERVDAWRLIGEEMASPPDDAAATEPADTFIELVEHVAEVALGGSRRLLATSLDWLDRHGCRGARLRIPDWSDRVLALLNSTGMFIQMDGDLRFAHQSLAEHLAAAAQARRLPATFDPENPAWAEAIHSAIKHSEMDIAVLVHHAQQTGSAEALLVWLETGHNDHRLLAGQLLADGVSAGRSHTAAFLDSLRNWAAEMGEYDYGPTWLRWSTAARLDDQEVQAFLREVATSSARSDELRIHAIQALAVPAPNIALDAIRALVEDPATDESSLPDAASVLAELDPRLANEAAQILKKIIEDVQSNPYDRLRAVEVLGELDSSYETEAAQILKKMVASPETNAGIKIVAAQDLATLDPLRSPEAAQALRDVIADRNVDHAYRRDASQALARLGRQYMAEAADHLRALVEDPEAGDAYRWCVAAAIAELGPKYIPEAAEMLRKLINIPHSSYDYPWSAGQALASLGPQYVAEAADDLRALIADQRLNDYDRVRSAEALAAMDPHNVPEAAEVLRLLMADPEQDPHIRYESAQGLAGLGPRYCTDAIVTLTQLTLNPHIEAQLKRHIEQTLTDLADLDTGGPSPEASNESRITRQ